MIGHVTVCLLIKGTLYRLVSRILFIDMKYIISPSPFLSYFTLVHMDIVYIDVICLFYILFVMILGPSIDPNKLP